MPPIMANCKDGQDQEDNYLENSRKILSQEMLMCNMKALTFIILLKIMLMFKVSFLENRSNVKVKNTCMKDDKYGYVNCYLRGLSFQKST